jgi:hypothetical protein
MTRADRAQIAGDLRYWNAGIVVLLPDAPHRATLERVLTQALGPHVTVGGVKLWDVRRLNPGSGSPASPG